MCRIQPQRRVRAPFVNFLFTFFRAQSWFEASLHMHSKLIMRSDEYAETLQWNLCRGTVASVTAVVENGVSAAAYLRSLDAPIHDPLLKLNLDAIAGTYQ